jgi:hypothetical protein
MWPSSGEVACGPPAIYPPTDQRGDTNHDCGLVAAEWRSSFRDLGLRLNWLASMNGG